MNCNVQKYSMGLLIKFSVVNMCTYTYKLLVKVSTKMFLILDKCIH